VQTLSAYFFESPDLSDDALRTCRDAALSEVSHWLNSKKVVDPHAAAGSFKSRTPGFPDGHFARETLEAAGGYLQQTTLTEASGKGQNIETRVSVVSWDRRVSVHVNVNVYNVATILAPAHIIPRCPKIVQRLLKLPTRWLLNGDPAPSGTVHYHEGEVGGQTVADELLSSTRAAPVIVVSQYDGEAIWPNLGKHLASDLAGLAHVMEIDDEASDVIEEEVGRSHRCFGGAVRLYWPQDPRNGSGKLYSELWTARNLVDLDYDDVGEERFRDIIRERIMNVAAQTVTPSRAVRLIQNAAANEFIEELRSRQTSAPDSEAIQIVELYAQQNESLRNELEQSNQALALLSSKYEASQYALGLIEKNKSQGHLDDVEAGSDDDLPSAPVAGDVRFVKKTGSSGPYDRMVEWGGCNHSSWETMGNAPKALKGIQRHFGENQAWKRIEKCLACTGGGAWRVTW
jgi:hypothetical protein